MANTNPWPSNGPVGIGTNSPSVDLEVQGNQGGSPIHKVINQADAAYTPAIEATAPNLTAGHNVYFAIGRNAASNNQFSLGFTYAGSGSSSNRLDVNAYGSSPLISILASGNIGVGKSNPGVRLDVEGADGGNPIVNVVNLADSPYTPNFEVNAPNLTTGHNTYFAIGRDRNPNNQFSFGFTYAGNGNSSNRLDINAYGSSALLSVLASGNVGIGTTTPTAKLQIDGDTYQNGGQRGNVTSTTTPITLSDAHHTVFVDTSSADITITLPSAASHSGRQYCIKNINKKLVTVIAASSGTIDGKSQLVLNMNDAATIVSNGISWYIF